MLFSIWELITRPPGKSPVGCRWVYTMKVGPDGPVDRLKARFIAKGILNNMARTIMIHFLQWPRLPLFTSSSLDGANNQKSLYPYLTI